MNDRKEILWELLHPILDEFGKKVTNSDPSVVYDVGSSSNDAFLLRGYVAVRKSAKGEELAVTVDAVVAADVIAVSSDACLDSGEVLAEGPAVNVSSIETLSSWKGAMADWSIEFQDFLLRIEPIVKARIAELQ